MRSGWTKGQTKASKVQNLGHYIYRSCLEDSFQDAVVAM